MDFFASLWPELVKAARAMSLLEIAGVVFNVAAVILTIRASVFNFPVGIVACALFFALFWQYKLYADAILQIFFLVLVLYGWWNWTKQKKVAPDSSASDLPETELPVRHAPRLILLSGLLGAAVFGFLWGLGLHRFTDAALPFWDAQIAAFSVLAQWFIARKWVENWPIWIGVNIVSTGVFWHKDLKLTAVLYAFFLVLAFLGWREWNKKAAL